MSARLRCRAIRRRAIFTSPGSPSRAGRRKRSLQHLCLKSSAPSRGRSRCVGARRPARKASAMAASKGAAATRCAGCGRCNPSSAPSVPRPKSRWWSISRSTASAPATSPTAIVSTRRRRSPCAASTIMRRSWRRRRSCSTPTGARRSSLPMRRTLPSPTGLNWSKTRACWRKCPVWSNGLSC